MRLLLVEDHPALGPDVKKGLEDCHYAVDLVTSGSEALELTLLVPYDLIILDILFHDLDGRDVCRQLRAQHQSIPLLFLSALGEGDDRVHRLDLGADDYLTKPFCPFLLTVDDQFLVDELGAAIGIHAQERKGKSVRAWASPASTASALLA